MVGLVFVSHIKKLAEGAVDLARLLAPDVPMEAAGGLPDGSSGTDMEKITQAIQEADQGDGVLIMMDMGSSVMTTDMVLEMDDNPNHRMVNGPFVESGIIAAVAAQGGDKIEDILADIEKQKGVDKF